MASLEEKTLPVASVVFRGAVFWEVSSILALLLPSSKRGHLFVMYVTPGRKLVYSGATRPLAVLRTSHVVQVLGGF